MVICADDTIFYPKLEQASGLMQQLELASELESDLRETLDWLGSGLKNSTGLFD